MAAQISYLSRGFQRLQQFPVKSAASFKKGQFLIWNAGVTRHAATDANLGGIGSTTYIVGRAEEDSTRADGTFKAVVSVMIAEPGTEFGLPLYHATAASAIPKCSGQLGTAYELRNVGGNYDAVALDATTNVKLVVVDFTNEDYLTYPGPITGAAVAIADGTTVKAVVWVAFLVNGTIYGRLAV